MGVSSRRALLRPLLASAGVLTVARSAWATTRFHGSIHPEPRPGVTGTRVLTRRQLDGTPALIPVFDAVRAAPRVVPDMAFTFTRVAGRPDWLEVRYDDDALAGTARRKK